MYTKSISAAVLSLLLGAAPLAAAPVANTAIGVTDLPIQLVQGRDPAPSGPANVTPRGPSGPAVAPRSGPSPRWTGPRGPSQRFTGPRGPSPRWTGPRAPSQRFTGPGGPSPRFYGPGPGRSYARFHRAPGNWRPGHRFWGYPAFGAGLLAFTLAPGWYWGDYYDECLRYIVPCPGCAPVLVDLCEQPY